MSARVLLGETLVGELHPRPASGETELEFDSGYASSADRPVLGRWFEDHQIAPPRTFRGAPLPNYFRNVLPEGALRKLVEKRLGPSALPEYTMLLRLGENLPGAVRVVSDELDPDPLEEGERESRKHGDPFRFALTGVQPKLTLFETNDRLTVPLEGGDGYWIAKLGSPALKHLVANEDAMLAWAKACGLVVPEHRIIRATEIVNLPSDFEPEQDVLIIRRFDRGAGGVRIHQEDFAQVFNIPPEDRYAHETPELGWIHYGSIGAVVRALCGEHDHQEYLRRLVFMVLSGNADAHAKNWALVYPDGLRPHLSPAYDLVSTVVYGHYHDHSALRWDEPLTPSITPPKRMADVTDDDLLLAVGAAPDAARPDVLDDLVQFGHKVRETWPSIAARAPANVRDRVTAHLASSSLYRP